MRRGRRNGSSSTEAPPEATAISAMAVSRSLAVCASAFQNACSTAEPSTTATTVVDTVAA